MFKVILCTVVAWAALGLVARGQETGKGAEGDAEARQALVKERLGLALRALEAGDPIAAGDWAGDVLELEPGNVTALHLTGITQMIYGEWEAVSRTLGDAMAKAQKGAPKGVKFADRALLMNLCMAETASDDSGDNVRAIQRLVEYLDAQPDVDEGALNLLGTALAWTDREVHGNHSVLAAVNAYTQYDEKLNAKRPDAKRWGVQWLPLEEYQPLYEEWQKREKALGDQHRLLVRAAKELRKAYDRARQELTPNLFQPQWRNDLASRSSIQRSPAGRAKLETRESPGSLENPKDGKAGNPAAWAKSTPRPQDVGAYKKPDLQGEVATYKSALAHYRDAHASVPRPRFPQVLVAVPAMVPMGQTAAPEQVEVKLPKLAEIVPPREPRGDMRERKRVGEKPSSMETVKDGLSIARPPEVAAEGEPAMLPAVVVRRGEGRQVTRTAAAFAVGPHYVVTTAAVVENNRSIKLIDAKGKPHSALVVRTHPHAGLALLQVLSKADLRSLPVAEKFETGGVQLRSTRVTAGGLVPRVAAGTINVGKERRFLFLPEAPRRGGAPLLAGGKVVGVAVASRGWNAKDLPYADLEELRDLLAGLRAISGPYAGKDEGVYEVRVEAEVRP